MKISDILNEYEYSGPSMTFDDSPKDDIMNFGGPDSPDHDNALQSRMFLRQSVTVKDHERVQIVKDGKVLKDDEWGKVRAWLKDNWNSMSGTYFLSRGTQVLTTIQTTSSSATAVGSSASEDEI